MDYIIRQAIAEDRSFITSSWINSYYDSNFAQASKPELNPETSLPLLPRKPYINIPRNLYLRCHPKVVHYLLDKPTVSVFVAANEDLIYGYVVFEKETPNPLVDYPVIHYIYVKRVFNNMGIGKALLKASPFPIKPKRVIGTHMTYRGEQLFKRLGLIYCPYIL